MTATEHTDRLFREAALSSDGKGYPRGSVFVTFGGPDWQSIAISNLIRGHPTVLVREDATEYLLVPRPRPWPLGMLDRVSRRPNIEIYWRHDDHAHGGIATRINRHKLERIDREPELAI
jgi:hypothetical protein